MKNSCATIKLANYSTLVNDRLEEEGRKPNLAR